MRTIKKPDGGIIITSNDEPSAALRALEERMITTHNIEAFTARRKAEADAAKEKAAKADKAGTRK